MSAVSAIGVDRPYELRCDGVLAHELEVVRFHGEEAVSAPYVYRIEVATDMTASEVESRLFCAPSALTIASVNHATRVVTGLLRSVEVRGTVRVPHGTKTLIALELVPRLSLLRERRNSRVFQDRTVPEIVDAVLEQWSIPRRWALTGSHAKREYCVQHQETDLDFLTRILSEEAIYFFHEFPSVEAIVAAHAGAAVAAVVDAVTSIASADGDDQAAESSTPAASRAVERIVFGDSPHATEIKPPMTPEELALAPVLRIGEAGSALANDAERIFFMTKKRVWAPTSLRVRDYAPTNDRYDLKAEAVAAPDRRARFPEDPRASIYQYLPARPLSGSGDRDGVARELAQLRRESSITHGESNCPRLIPGHRFFVGDQDELTLLAPHVVTRIVVDARTPWFHADAADGRGTYHSTFESMRANAPLLPPRIEKPRANGLDTAVVVGPTGLETYVDSLGRVKVQFRWDIDLPRDGDRSCWVRVAQGWAGTGFGSHFAPRVGMEVLVGFLGGDYDRPVIVGCVPNSSNPSPYRLPGDAAKSGIITRSTPGGTGYNELTFDDAAGSESIHLRAERDLDVVVRNDHAVRVRHDHALHVEGDARAVIGGKRSETIEGDDERSIGGGARVRVAGAEAIEIGGATTARITSTLALDVADRANARFGSDLRIEVDGRRLSHVEGDAVEQIGGAAAIVVGTPETPRAFLLHVDGEAVLESTKPLELSSKQSIRLTCGKSSIVITDAGITLSAELIRLEGKKLESVGDSFNVAAEKLARVQGKKVFVLSDGASVALTGDAKIDGGTVYLKESPDSSDGPEAKQDPPAPTKIKLADQDGNPIPGARFVIRRGDGTERLGVLDDAGEASIAGLEGSAEVVFPDFTDVGQG